jgi:hypothetical protein
MLARLILITFLLIAWAIFWAFLPLWLAVSLYGVTTFIWVLLNLYPDKFLLHYFQARETIETDHPAAYRVARAQAYKFKIPAPRIYSYSGFFHRAYALSAQTRTTFLVERKILEQAQETELEALFFSLSLQAHEGVVRRYTSSLLLLALIWAPALKILSLGHRKTRAPSWAIQFLVAPFASLVFRTVHPTAVWKNFIKKLGMFPWENSRLMELNARLEQPRLEKSISRLLNFRFYAANHTSSQQMILAIEGASHPLDLLHDVNMGEANA